MTLKQEKKKDKSQKNKLKQAEVLSKLNWLKVVYSFHSYAYRDPRSVFPSAVGLPVVSPTTVLLGVASTLFSIGLAEESKSFLQVVHQCKVIIDPPESIVFFRAFHQVRRYETDKKFNSATPPNPRIGLTDINQGTREYGLFEGNMSIFLGVPHNTIEVVKLALTNLTHLGTHDSLCSLVGNVEECNQPENVVYMLCDEFRQKIRDHGIQASLLSAVTVVTLSKFKEQAPINPACEWDHWYMSGGDDTELVTYVISGKFEGTTRGKIYRKK